MDVRALVKGSLLMVTGFVIGAGSLQWHVSRPKLSAMPEREALEGKWLAQAKPGQPAYLFEFRFWRDGTVAIRNLAEGWGSVGGWRWLDAGAIRIDFTEKAGFPQIMVLDVRMMDLGEMTIWKSTWIDNFEGLYRRVKD